MVFSIKKCAEFLFSIAYPSLCIHCHRSLEKSKTLLCEMCWEQIEWLDPLHRCRCCFAELHKKRCERCLHRSIVIQRQIAVCERIGPAHTLLHHFQYADSNVISSLAALMAYQWLKQEYLPPDLLIPLPVCFWSRRQLGLDLNFQLACAVGKILAVPVLVSLKQKWDREYFQTHKEFRYRFTLLKKKRDALCDRRLLLIAPLLDDALLRRAAQELKLGFAAQIDALTFCQ